AAGIFGEFLVNAQGEDVVAGIRTPQTIVKSADDVRPAMEELMPAAFDELVGVAERLEAHYQDMQDIEFTIQAGKLWMLQTRNGKRSTVAALKIAVDMVEEGVIDKRRAVSSIDPASLDQVLHPTLDPKAPRDLIVTGLPASPGAAVGKIVFTADEAEQRAEQGEAVILVRTETSPEDIHGMHAARAIVTSRGGMTSHAAVVARGMGRPCVCGAGSLVIDIENRQMSVGDRIIGEGDVITVDGDVGEVLFGEVPTIQPVLSGDFATVMTWADEFRRLRVRTNAETPHDAAVAVEFGAEGIGLCRTEHMFFDAGRIVSVREMILAANVEDRRAALEKLLPMQRQDFAELFRIMGARPVTIRLLDPPLHEFLPQSTEEIAVVAEAAGVDAARLRRRIAELHESNPMLGHRGCRLGISYPEIYEMQARAILEAAGEVAIEAGAAPALEIMIPLVATKAEFDIIKQSIDRVAAAVAEAQGTKPPYLVGTMIELPRAALRAGDIAQSAEFFSFGTNDLTQTTFGISRDDAASFLGDYQRAGILETDPFASIDTEGVGELLEIASQRGRATRPDLKLGICGEHGGDPASVHFFHTIGLDYVSCSPYRVPIARLAAAQAALADG
ncbi:MAG: pyruvate, phosphate dikinase, partial [Proteobacteria bacterium]|nr:pyruvate, phosphate dikinase [Pseudomonadota bacterium]